MIVLGIESTCDETGASVVQNGRILSNVVASSADVHEKYGGVFPELACRRHIDAIIPVIKESLDKAGVTPEEIDLIAVAKGPGLIGALLIGLNVAKGLAIAWNKPLVGVNHVEAHVFASMLSMEEIPLPALGVVLSGGHTMLVKILEVGRYEPISTTVDDAIGEAFDKLAATLGLPYPGGPHVERIAKLGNPKGVALKAGRVKTDPLAFSFSGLKTAAIYAKRDGAKAEDLAASFQETAFRDVAKKAKAASGQFDCKAIFFGGGVCCNERLKEIMHEAFPQIPLYFPPKGLTADNAAMIAALGEKKFTGEGETLSMEAETRIPLAANVLLS